ncbi:Lrp/AsnC family transcriptional regulator [Alisedimentitalea sp. MJ-SS2]|uniref:siroheme decarboxylase subunit beta n=1 Tax=Aliisedimentitalea sp. MJ-SS2 TaxID=3049795 RepID=UPI00291567DD|nr:Lrp/AsnC family transcriptional regulator [Alisedimentitalea sp. MJ-SS2]MDU8927190.1 Lrp/AsnC family transcriptional regulator [Alisedimentitalea sp. MJ-SS2]
MKLVADPTNRHLLDDWQRDFPVISRPFKVLAEDTGLSEDEVIARLSHLQRNGTITRVGGTCAPNTLSASTLAAVAAPIDEIDRYAQIINEELGVNHSYEREDDWNIWFVVTGPDREHVNQALARIERRTGSRVLDLRLVRPFNVDLGFRMTGTTAPKNTFIPKPADMSAIIAGDREVMHALTRGLEIVAEPYAALSAALGRSEEDILTRITALSDAGILSRLGVIVRHRALGWRSNAMVVWDIDHDRITEAGPQLATLPGVTLCYERQPVNGTWPYRLYSMIHAKSREDAQAVLASAANLPGLRDVPHKALFSTRCFRQTGAMIAANKVAAE